MLSFSLNYIYSCPFPSARALKTLSSPCFLSPNPRLHSRVFRIFRGGSNLAGELNYDHVHDHLAGRRINYTGVRLDETVEVESGKVRLDSWISSRIVGISRARVQTSIRSGLVSVNGKIIDKVSHTLRAGDNVNCTISELQPLRAEPEDIPLEIIYEDEHVLVVNKPAHMYRVTSSWNKICVSRFYCVGCELYIHLIYCSCFFVYRIFGLLDFMMHLVMRIEGKVVHPAPGNASGTLVNAILHHCSLPSAAFPDREVYSEEEDVYDDEFASLLAGQRLSEGPRSSICMASVRPGIVHRLDKGTSGLLVVAKNEYSHAQLSEQFKLHTIYRVYVSLTCGVPNPVAGRVEVPVGRDLSNRIRMAAVSGPRNSGRARHAASRYKVIEILAGGGSALVEWRLETGRTHQIRVHAKYIGVPLLGDEVYGGTKSMALSLLRPRTPPSCHGQLSQLVSRLERPCLHALALGFTHPKTGEKMRFSCPPPADFTAFLSQLRNVATK